MLLEIEMKNSFSASHCRKSELHQVAQQASNIGELTEVIRASLSVMTKQWSDAMHTFQEKFDSLSTLIINHGSKKYYRYSLAIFFLIPSDVSSLRVGLDSSPQEEFLSLLGGARTSPPVHQFVVNSLGEVVHTVFSLIISEFYDHFVFT